MNSAKNSGGRATISSTFLQHISSTCVSWHSTERKSFLFPLPFILIHLCYHVFMDSFILWVIIHYFLILMLRLSQVFVFVIFYFWLCSVACQILVPWTGIKPVPPAVEAWSPNHWEARGFPVPVLTSESLFELSSVSFWYDLSFLRGRQESDTTEQLTDTHITWCSGKLVLSQLQLYNHSIRNQDLGTWCSYCYWGVISSKASQVDIAGNICVDVYIYVHISIFSVHICAAFSDCEKLGFHPQYIFVFAQF